MSGLLGRIVFVASLWLLITVALAGRSVGAGEPNTLTPEEIAEGWILLFDGESLFGWRAADKADWKVVDGVITAGKGEPGLLRTTSQWGNFVLKIDFRTAEGTNSGVLLRSPPVMSDLKRKAYEVSIEDAADSRFPTGSLVRRKRCRHDGHGSDWRTFEIAADEGHFTIKLDRRQVLEYADPKPPGRGFIGLEFCSGKIEFRNIKLKPLGMKSIFNGRDLSGWKTYPNMKSVATATPQGWLNIKGGKGQLETVGQYADFTLQLDVFVNGKGLNSGIFFRSIPGDPMNGYESQIHNGYLDGDRTRPTDCGTGGIFRRQNARKVVANDFEWFAKTIHVDDKHMAVWVNGYQVSDWSDNRKPHKNPRKGLRLQPGTIIIQGHDPGTDLSLRNLRIAEIPQR